MSRIEELQEQLEKLTTERDQELARVRANCKHVRLIELDAQPPMRMCLDCGAEERGWYCGYQVLAMSNDSTSDAPHKAERGIVIRTADSHDFYRKRKKGPIFCVGQSHPNFSGGGRKTYEQLTELVSAC